MNEQFSTKTEVITEASLIQLLQEEAGLGKRHFSSRLDPLFDKAIIDGRARLETSTEDEPLLGTRKRELREQGAILVMNSRHQWISLNAHSPEAIALKGLQK